MGVDMIVMWIVHYETGTIYIKYPLPVTSIVRPFMLVGVSLVLDHLFVCVVYAKPLPQIMMFPSLRRSAWDFMKTMYYSRAVLALAVVFIAIGTATSVALFRHEIAQHAVSLSDGYDTFQVRIIFIVNVCPSSSKPPARADWVYHDACVYSNRRELCAHCVRVHRREQELDRLLFHHLNGWHILLDRPSCCKLPGKLCVNQPLS